MKSTLLVGAALLSALVFSPAQAREKVGNHTLGSAPDVWRVELRDLRTLKVLSSGDDDGVSELRSVTVRLSSPDGQSHHFVETSPYFRVARDGRYENATSRSRNNSVNVRVGDTLFLDNIIADRAERPADYSHYYNLWLHTRQRTSGDIERPQIQFDVAVETRELDCAGDRVCRRGSTGKSIYTVTAIGLRPEEYGTHSLRRTKASIIYKATGNIRAIQILLGHSKIENTVRYLGVDIEDALTLAEKTEI